VEDKNKNHQIHKNRKKTDGGFQGWSCGEEVGNSKLKGTKLQIEEQMSIEIKCTTQGLYIYLYIYSERDREI
jgi:hypothetical protein